MHRHIKRLKKHRNFLYSLVFLLLVLQTASFVVLSLQVSRIDSQQGVIKEDIDSYVFDLEDKIDSVRQENQFNINEISKEIVQQKTDIEGQIDLIKSSSQQDFSGVIENVIKGVVSVGTDKAAGTGFVISNEGYIVTNQHVINDGRFVRVLSFDGQVYDAALIGEDIFTDLALLKIKEELPSLVFESSDNVQTGEKVIAIGNPLGLSFTVTEGIVSAKNRRGPNGLEAYIQTDVTLNPGNSGGPLINKEGNVIGINNFKIGGAESLGFALESEVMIDVVNELAEKRVV